MASLTGSRQSLCWKVVGRFISSVRITEFKSVTVLFAISGKLVLVQHMRHRDKLVDLHELDDDLVGLLL